jgi:hypothetical protein
LTKQEEDNVTEQIEKFKQSNSPDKLLLVSRYDGVDLPGDICRVMVIDKLPSSLNPLEIYFWEQLSLVKSLRSAIALSILLLLVCCSLPHLVLILTLKQWS